MPPASKIHFAGLQGETFLTYCDQQGVIGPIASFFESFAPRHPFMSALLEQREKIALRNLWFQSELERLRLSLDQAEIDYVVLKGIPLIERLYRSLSDRPCADIDLLFRLEDLPAALGVLRDLGYEPGATDAEDMRRLAKSGEGVEFTLANGGSVDLHFNSPSAFCFAPIPSFAEMQVGPLGDLQLFSVLCDHGTKHMWLRLNWLLDLALLLASSPVLTKRNLSTHFSMSGHSRILKFTFALMAEYSILPAAYFAATDKDCLPRQRAFVVARHKRLVSAPEIFPRNLIQHLALLEGFSRKFCYMKWRIFHLTAADLGGSRRKNVATLCFASRLRNLISNRVKRFFGPLIKWPSNTTTSVN